MIVGFSLTSVRTDRVGHALEFLLSCLLRGWRRLTIRGQNTFPSSCGQPPYRARAQQNESAATRRVSHLRLDLRAWGSVDPGYRIPGPDVSDVTSYCVEAYDHHARPSLSDHHDQAKRVNDCALT